MNEITDARLPFNPAVFRWARNRLRLSTEMVAKRVATTVERVAEWESREGKRQPTVKQARKLAELYDRPFLEFFSAEIPVVPDVDLVPDYRFHRRPPTELEIVALKEVQRWAEEQRLNALDLLELLGDEPPKVPAGLYAKIHNDVDYVAGRVREYAAFPVERQFSLNAAEKRILPDLMRAAFSECGVLVLKQSGLNKIQTRGMCLFAEPLPVIVYGSEAPGAQAFTLAHEFGHVLLKQSAISGSPRFGRATDERKRVEGWCNQFAAAFLVPADALSAILARPNNPPDTFDNEVLSKLALQFGVSRHAMLIRLVNLGYVKRSYYWRVKRPQFIKEEDEYESPPMRSRYYGTRYKNSLGNFYTGLVLEAWGSGRLSGHNAAEFMGIKNLQHLEDIRQNFMK